MGTIFWFLGKGNEPLENTWTQELYPILPTEPYSSLPTLLMKSPFLLGGHAMWNGIPTISQEKLEAIYGHTVIYQSELGEQLALLPPGVARFVAPSVAEPHGTFKPSSDR